MRLTHRSSTRRALRALALGTAGVATLGALTVPTGAYAAPSGAAAAPVLTAAGSSGGAGV